MPAPVDVTEYALFPTRLVAIQHGEVDQLNRELVDLFKERSEFADGFNMHPDALNLLRWADEFPGLARLRAMFLAGMERWLAAEGVAAPEGVDLVLFSNRAKHGEFTLVHNHNADLVGVYYASTAAYDRPPLNLADDGADYFDPGAGVLVLHDPRFNANLAAVRCRDHLKVYPRPGLMLIFPGYVWHSVTPHAGAFDRLSFSMNYTLRWPNTATRIDLANPAGEATA